MTLDSWLQSSRERYLSRVERLHDVTRKVGVRNVAAFVLCTPRQTYENAMKQWTHWMQTGEVAGSIPNERKAYIEALPSGTWLARKSESPAEWCRRIERKVRGLGPAKSAFLCSLLEPAGADTPVCIDIWMLRGMYGTDEASTSRIRAAQNIAAFMAKRYEMPRFAWQWATWDYWRSRGNFAAPLFVTETNIAADLEAARRTA